MTTLVLLALVIGAGAFFYNRSVHSQETVPGIQVAGTRLGAVSFADLGASLRRVAQGYLDASVTLRFGDISVRATRRALGAQLDIDETRVRLQHVGKHGSFLRDMVERIRARRGKLSVPLALQLDRDQALGYFTDLKEQVDRPVVQPKLDLERQRVTPGRQGYKLHVYDCLVATELALRRGATEIQLAVSVVDPNKTEQGQRLKDLDISHVLGTFSTVYSLADTAKDRAHNLKVGASKIDGRILMPGERMSFNEQVGRRTEAEGYRMAKVINEGELVDGMAGGACQLSSTLFAASFFAGLDLESSRPHTRPSSYIKMGLDAAVAYPTTDLVIKNPYPFPVVLHYKVSRGKVRVRILGKKRPWRRIVFERELVSTEPFKEIVRKDDSIPKGKRVVSQTGTPGVVLLRRRLFFGDKGAKPKKSEERKIRYPPNTQYIREGTGPADPEWKPPKEHAPFGQVPETYTLSQ